MKWYMPLIGLAIGVLLAQLDLHMSLTGNGITDFYALFVLVLIFLLFTIIIPPLRPGLGIAIGMVIGLFVGCIIFSNMIWDEQTRPYFPFSGG